MLLEIVVIIHFLLNAYKGKGGKNAPIENIKKSKKKNDLFFENCQNLSNAQWS